MIYNEPEKNSSHLKVVNGGKTKTRKEILTILEKKLNTLSLADEMSDAVLVFVNKCDGIGYASTEVDTVLAIGMLETAKGSILHNWMHGG